MYLKWILVFVFGRRPLFILRGMTLCFFVAALAFTIGGIYVLLIPNSEIKVLKTKSTECEREIEVHFQFNHPANDDVAKQKICIDKNKFRHLDYGAGAVVCIRNGSYFFIEKSWAVGHSIIVSVLLGIALFFLGLSTVAVQQ